MRTIALFHPRTFHEKNYRYHYVPYSLLSVASALDRSHYDVVLIDNNAAQSEDWKPWLASLREPPLCVGITSMVGAQIKEGIAFGRAIHEVWPGVPVVWGGGLPTVLPELTASHPAVDVAVQGQGQETFAELVARLAGQRRGRRPERVAGGRRPGRLQSLQSVRRLELLSAVPECLRPGRCRRLCPA